MWKIYMIFFACVLVSCCDSIGDIKSEIPTPMSKIIYMCMTYINLKVVLKFKIYELLNKSLICYNLFFFNL